MIAEFKPYSDYKESGLSWLGKVPKHWEMRPAFGAYEPILDRNRGMKEKTVLSLSYGRIIIKPAEKLHGLVPESFETYQIVNPGDIVLRTTDLQNDHTSLRVGTVRDRGIITSAYLALRVKAGVSADFGYQFLNVWDMSKAIYGYGSGLRQNLDFTHFKRMPVALPPPDEQAAIVRFLDDANHRLEKAIRAKRQVIALLNEQKQAIIHRAVTRGLDPTVSLKPSGIPWLGDIPKQWEVRPLKHWAKLNNRTLSDKVRPEYEFKYIDIGTVGTGRLVREPVRVKFKQAPSRARRVLSKGDTIISTVRTYLKAVYFVDSSDTDLVASTGFAVLSPGPDVLPEFLSIGVQSPAFIDRVTANSIGIAYPAIAESRLGAFHLAIPPDKTEQAAILQYVQSSSSPFDTTIARTEREIALLREYRTRLIADVVTGKLDVREAARNLPEEIVESGVINDNEISAGDEELEESPEMEREEA